METTPTLTCSNRSQMVSRSLRLRPSRSSFQKITRSNLMAFRVGEQPGQVIPPLDRLPALPRISVELDQLPPHRGAVRPDGLFLRREAVALVGLLLIADSGVACCSHGLPSC